jgi:hypothetical protein
MKHRTLVVIQCLAFFAFCWTTVSSDNGAGQGRQPQEAARLATQETAPQAEPPQPPTEISYSYRSGGRRDPFVSLLKRGTDLLSSSRRPEGVQGIAASELVLKGIVTSRGEFLALIQGTDGRSHVVRANDRLFDATVKAITADSLIVVQEVNDPLSLNRQQEIRKSLRVVEEIK